MLNSLLFHLEADDRGTEAIPIVVDMAVQHGARLRGLMIADTRRLIASAVGCEAAVYAATEGELLQRQSQRQSTALSELTHACLQAGVDFDVRRLRGDPLELLPREARFHDLIVTTRPRPHDREGSSEGISTLTELAIRGAQPLLVLRDSRSVLKRVLLIYDGSVASERAIKQCLLQRLFHDAEMRLLAIGATDVEARRNLAEMAECLRHQQQEIELGHACGSLRQIAAAYIRKWDADVVVVGAPQRRILGFLWGGAVADTLRQTRAAVYVSG
ncbi:MAG: universal stress protein [Planctomycetaceae bacterium]|nr:universal stress protein [Planctomycetaceae bacterium]